MRVVVIDGGYESYDAEASILAPLGARVEVSPCDGEAAKVKHAVVDADAVLVRESPVDRATVEALRERRLQGAGLDVYESEPPRRDHPLFALDNVVLSDHTGWYSEESVAELQEKAAQEVARVLRGEAPRNWLNPW